MSSFLTGTAESLVKACAAKELPKRRIYVIAITGRADLGNEDFAAFDGYLHKPITFELLERVLGEWQTAAGLYPTTPGAAEGLV